MNGMVSPDNALDSHSLALQPEYTCINIVLQYLCTCIDIPSVPSLKVKASSGPVAETLAGDRRVVGLSPTNRICYFTLHHTPTVSSSTMRTWFWPRPLVVLQVPTTQLTGHQYSCEYIACSWLQEAS